MSSKPWRSAKVRRSREDAERFVRVLESEMPPGVTWVTGGSFRRHAPTVGDLDVGVMLEDGFAGFEFPAHFVMKQGGERKVMGDFVLDSGESIHLDFWAVKPREWGAFLAYVTGPVALNIRHRALALRMGYTLNEKGLFATDGTQVDNGTERNIYERLGIPWIPPEERERYAEAKPSDATSVRTWERWSSTGVGKYCVTRRGTGPNAVWSCTCNGFKYRHRHGRTTCRHIDEVQAELAEGK